MKHFESNSLIDTENFAKTWLAHISQVHASQKNEATLVGLSGHLGAGKTAFTKLVGRILGITEEITSPTFVIMKMYTIDHPLWKRFIHIDAYRLERPGEIEVLKFDQLASDPHNLIFIEWPENVGLTADNMKYTLKFTSEDGVYTID